MFKRHLDLALGDADQWFRGGQLDWMILEVSFSLVDSYEFEQSLLVSIRKRKKRPQLSQTLLMK